MVTESVGTLKKLRCSDRMGEVKTLEAVHSVSEFLAHLEHVNRIRNMTYTVSSFTFFRGQANADWSLSPSLYRRGLFQSENLLLTEISHLCPCEIPENRFDDLVKMQHYGMPTRLLDTTTNPLVALYFACESSAQKDRDGAVYIFPNLPVLWSTDPLVQLIMDFVFDYPSQNVCLDEMLERVKEQYASALHRSMPQDADSLLYYLTIPAFSVMPAKTNERIEAQDGAFFIFGMSLRNREVSRNPGTLGRVYCNFDPANIETSEKIWHASETLIVPASAKSTILEQLDVLGVNERKLFPDLPHQIAYTVDAVIKNKFKPPEKTIRE